MHKIYLAVLNDGWLRREFDWFVLPTLRGTEGVSIQWENPGLTWSNPISSNRNLITQRFLESDCEWLLMIDNDVVPLCNPAELVYANKDIVGFPARVRSTGQTIVWTAYRDHPSGTAYSAVDFTQLDDMIDLIEVEIVGTGCILIHRRVLEKLKAPFHSEFDENGVQIYGTDFAFCRKAKQAGFTIYTAPNYKCEHFKELGLNDIQGWDDIRNFNKINAPYEIPWGGWSITQKDWAFLKRIIEEVKPKRILEFGAGLSSLLMSEITSVICYETSQEYWQKIYSKITDKNKLRITLWDGETLPESFQKGDFDFAFVDGPIGETAGGIGRQHSLKIASELCDRIVLHDSGRQPEIHWQRQILRGIFARIEDSGDHETRCTYWVRRSKELTNQNFFL